MQATERRAANERGGELADYVAGARERGYPDAIVSAAKIALVDYVGVALGAVDAPAARAVSAVAGQWNMPGKARIFGGGNTGAAVAALVNGTLAHCLDYDDTHIGGAGHISAPVWSTALAVAAECGGSEQAALSGFITGFEVMARLGGGGIRGVGRNMQQRGLHPTALLGCVGAAAASSVIHGLDARCAANALSVAATSAGGLVASFGSDSKPFHGGRAAMSGILAADLAAKGFEASPRLFELEGGMLSAFIQDGDVEVPELDFNDGWELERNGYKPFACCRATHASIQAAHNLRPRIGERAVRRITAKVHYSAQFTAGNPDPKNPLECKFSVAFCIAAALSGYALLAPDFRMETLRDPAVQALLPLVELRPQRDQPQFEAYLTVELESGEVLEASTHLFLGHPDNPMPPELKREKFMSLVAPVMGEKQSGRLLAVLERFDEAGAFAETMSLLSGQVVRKEGERS